MNKRVVDRSVACRIPQSGFARLDSSPDLTHQSGFCLDLLPSNGISRPPKSLSQGFCGHTWPYVSTAWQAPQAIISLNPGIIFRLIAKLRLPDSHPYNQPASIRQITGGRCRGGYNSWPNSEQRTSVGFDPLILPVTQRALVNPNPLKSCLWDCPLTKERPRVSVSNLCDCPLLQQRPSRQRVPVCPAATLISRGLGLFSLHHFLGQARQEGQNESDVKL